MNLLALLLGIAIERAATKYLHWRRMRWLDRIIDFGFEQARRVANWPSLIPIVLMTVFLMLPVALVIYWLGGTLQGFTYLLLTVIVLLFSIGPTDIGEEVDDYCKALEDGDEELIANRAKSIIEDDVPADPRERMLKVEESVCIQANNRFFAIIFWFILLSPLGVAGPLAAWAYRATDLIRRRAVFTAARTTDEEDGVIVSLRDAAELLHGWFAWIPARLTAAGYVAAGNADEAIAAFRAPGEEDNLSVSEGSERLLARVGVAALAIQDNSEESLQERAVRGATAAHKLVFRLMIICVVLVAAMTLYGATQ